MQPCHTPEQQGHMWMLREFSRSRRLATDAVFTHLELHDPGQPIMLFILDRARENGVRPTQRELAREMRLSPATVTVSIKALVRRGYVRKLPDEDDLRKNRIEITDEGRAMAEECHRVFHLLDIAMFRGFSEKEIEEMSSYFARMSANLREIAENGEGALIR